MRTVPFACSAVPTRSRRCPVRRQRCDSDHAARGRRRLGRPLQLLSGSSAPARHQRLQRGREGVLGRRAEADHQTGRPRARPVPVAAQPVGGDTVGGERGEHLGLGRAVRRQVEHGVQPGGDAPGPHRGHLSQGGDELVSAVAVAQAGAADVTVETAGGDQLRERQLLDHAVLAVGQLLRQRNWGDERLRQHHPAQAQTGRQALARRADVDHTIGVDGLEQRRRAGGRSGARRRSRPRPRSRRRRGPGRTRRAGAATGWCPSGTGGPASRRPHRHHARPGRPGGRGRRRRRRRRGSARSARPGRSGRGTPSCTGSPCRPSSCRARERWRRGARGPARTRRRRPAARGRARTPRARAR